MKRIERMLEISTGDNIDSQTGKPGRVYCSYKKRTFHRLTSRPGQAGGRVKNLFPYRLDWTSTTTCPAPPLVLIYKKNIDIMSQSKSTYVVTIALNVWVNLVSVNIIYYTTYCQKSIILYKVYGIKLL